MIVRRVAQEWSKANPGKAAVIEPNALAKLVDNLSGLTAADAERLCRQAIFDDGALYSKWSGESEKNLRESLDSAQALAPCVLWIDEIEKALADGEGDSGTSRRVLGTFLTWLAEQRARIFVVATANDISALPPELIRKGRLDEIFFVDLPDDAARAAILAIHARKRSVSLSPQEVLALAKRSGGFSGAELEQAVVAALYSARASGHPVTAISIAHELQATKPLSVVMAEKIEALREWARDRTVPAE
jgi:SpoVK/Ycf46/Vps4 family AAA+-type ATPase